MALTSLDKCLVEAAGIKARATRLRRTAGVSAESMQIAATVLRQVKEARRILDRTRQLQVKSSQCAARRQVAELLVKISTRMLASAGRLLNAAVAAG